MYKIIVIFILTSIQISCISSSKKQYNFPKNHNNVSSYLNLKDQENMDITFLRPFEYKENSLIIVAPQKNIILFERKSDSNLEKSVFDVYDIQLSNDRKDNIEIAFRQGRYRDSDNFNYFINYFSNLLIFRESIKIDKNNFDIIGNIVHDLCVENLNIIDDWTKIHIVKN